MLKNILNLSGVQLLSKNQQLKLKGGIDLPNCGSFTCPPGNFIQVNPLTGLCFCSCV